MLIHPQKVLFGLRSESHLQMEAQTKTLAEPRDQGTASETVPRPLDLADYRRIKEE